MKVKFSESDFDENTYKRRLRGYQPPFEKKIKLTAQVQFKEISCKCVAVYYCGAAIQAEKNLRKLLTSVK